MAISLDKLPIKRLEAIEDNGLERFPPYAFPPIFSSFFGLNFLLNSNFSINFESFLRYRDIGHDEKWLSLIRRIDFAWAVQKDAKKQKSSNETAAPWPWQSLVENLQLAHQELSVIIDLINTVRPFVSLIVID